MPPWAAIVSPSVAEQENARPKRITRPRMPPSRTSRLLPLPTTVTGTSQRRARSRAAFSSSTSEGSAIQSAGPPTRRVVYRLIGTSVCTMSAGQDARSSFKKF